MARKRVHVQGSRAPTTENEFQSLCDLHDGGTYHGSVWTMARMGKTLVDIQSGGPGLLEAISEAKKPS